MESKEEIRQHEDYLETDLAQNLNVLWAIIVETHVTAIHGAGPAMRELEIVTLKNKLNIMRQKPNMLIGEFKKDFDDNIEVITKAGVDPVPQPELAMLFLTKLGPTRYALMMAQLTNDATLGKPFPQTLHAAWTIVLTWKAAGGRVQHGAEMHSVFTLADDDRKEPGRGGGRGRGRGRGRSGGRQGEKGPPSDQPQQKSSHITETRTCRGCLTKGHLYANCPDNPTNIQSAMVTTEDAHSVDYDNEYDTAFVCTTEPQETLVFFTTTDVLIDNQASRSIFCNDELLTKVESATPFYIGGIDSSSKGLLVNKRGHFGDYGHVAFQPDAAANVISVAEALNRGCTVVYSSPDDMLGVGVHNYVFSRKTVRGRKSSHYTFDMNNYTALVTTIADNMRNYTLREVSQARSARQLMMSLAHASSAAMIDMLDAGILNCSVTKTDVRNADAIFGPSIPSLKGKTVKRASTISPNVLAPRVTQVEQIMAVDIFFVKKLPFFLGVMIPLGLSMCMNLRNRGTECVASALATFLATASSRGFDCVIIKSDGEGAIGSMASTLNSEGIVVDMSGPGQHVPVVERKIQTIKQRVRCYENSLPYTMTKLLLVMCVAFCVSHINMQPSRTSHDRISPLEQFSGRKLDASRDLRIDFGEYVHAIVPDPDSTLAPRTQGCIALLSSGNSTGSVTIWCLGTNRTVKRDQITKLPTPDLVIAHINSIATSEGYSRGSEPDVGPLESDPRGMDELSPLPTMMALPDSAGAVHLADSISTVLDEGVNRPAETTMEVDTSSAASTTISATHTADAMEDNVTAGNNQESVNKMSSAAAILLELAGMRINQTQSTSTAAAGDKETAMTMTVKVVPRDRPVEAMSVMIDELRQMRTKKVWHGVKREDLSMQQYRAIIRSSMFLKDKYLASGAFDKFKARLVAGENQQDSV